MATLACEQCSQVIKLTTNLSSNNSSKINKNCKMSLRSCAYFGCENYSLNGCSHGHYTMFSFPKDSQRFEEWMRLGRVDKRIPVKQLYMCSDHFEQKYISVNSVRTNLLKNSVPIAYDDSCQEQSNDALEGGNLENENHEELDIVLESADTTELEEISEVNYKISEDFLSLTDNENENYSITRFEENTSSDEQEALAIELNISGVAKKRLLNNNTSVISRKKDVHTFIHKGEEYIQMPKAVYLNEKNDLLAKLRKYELLFGDIKKKLKNF